MNPDRRTGTICLIHLTEFRLCICPGQRLADAEVKQVAWCSVCEKHVSECACAEPDLQIRAAV